MKCVATLAVGILCFLSLTSVEAKPQPGILDKGKDILKHVDKNYCEKRTVEIFCGPKLFWWCDVGETGGLTTKVDNTCRYTGAFYGFVLGIPALVIILIIVGVVVFKKNQGGSGM